ncbi:replication endonuclease [Avibacterium paragallinarum]|uniref:replication endonuclease n=1 Tax=Avibacterium paragallinarum TaxID=728 RepID=UPI001C9944AD|nr:replication endonuclease [Avibacterium paragallinarum]QZP14812.1 replication endonuclease [Avibacterium paragallinarum]
MSLLPSNDSTASNRPEPFFQVSPPIPYKPQRDPDEQLTAAQLDLFETVPEEYEFVEAFLKQFPRARLREHFRHLYLREYRSVKDDGSIAFACGNKQRYHANTWLRALGGRLELVFSKHSINLEELFSFIAFQGGNSKWLEDLLSDPQFNATALNEKYKKFLNAEYHEEKNKHYYARWQSKQRNHASTPFYLITKTKLKAIADQLASAFNRHHYDYVKRIAKQHKTEPLSAVEIQQHFFKLYQQCGELCEKIGFPMNHWESHKNAKKLKGEIVDAALCRMACEKYWFKRMRTTQKQMVEHIAIACGGVRRGLAQYISNEGFKEWTYQIKKNHDFLKQMIVENIDDPAEQAELFDMYFKSSSNPALRRKELMNRLRGIEEWAEEKGHMALFLTLTAPSKYHSYHENGKENKKYNGATPKTTQSYLNKVWKRFRALLKKRRIAFYGMRVAEPHHDGTPHWHLLLYIQPKHKDEVIRLFRLKALEEDGDERGADEHRCKVEECDPAKGTPTGYIAKYISKNINGFALDDEYSDEDPEMRLKDNAARARAWASCWHLRQFQFYGDKFVTLWRELRRLASQVTKEERNQKAQGYSNQLSLELSHSQTKPYPKAWQFDDRTLARAVTCADVGDYAAFVDCLTPNGFLSERKDNPLKMHYETSEPNHYNETRQIIKGVKNAFSLAEPILTRLKKWVIKKGDPNRHTKTHERSEANLGGLARPWTCVSNCNLKERSNLEQKIRQAVRPIAKPLNDHQIEQLLIGKRLILNRKYSIQIINNDVVINESKQPVQTVLSDASGILQKIWKLFS